MRRDGKLETEEWTEAGGDKQRLTGNGTLNCLGLDIVSLLGHTVHLPQCEVAGQCLHTIIS